MDIKWWKFDFLWTGKDYMGPAYIATDKGKIKEKTTKAPRGPAEYFPGLLLPGFKNSHSHAFQYAFAGQTESLGTSNTDNFWTWRTSMYEVAKNISPECVEAVATQLYAEMLRHGYTSVVEFHYLHQDKFKEEKSIAMAAKHITAALRSGIRLMLVPVFYEKEGLIPQETHEAQNRFHCTSVESYQDTLKELKSLMRQAQEAIPPLLSLGKGVHSLRAVKKENLIKICESLTEKEPFHLHISEQKKEVSDCLKVLGKSPIHWLFDTVNVGENFHLVHATHSTKEELEKITSKGASVILCPSTEANLGDGFFDLSSYRKLGGYWSIGTDSHIGLSPMEELRWLEYGVRLQEQKRNTVCQKKEEESGEILYRESYMGAMRTMGAKEKDYFSEGEALDAIVVQSPQLDLSTKKLSTLIYGSTVDTIKATIVNGNIVVRDQKHVQSKEIEKEYRDAIRENFSKL